MANLEGTKPQKYAALGSSFAAGPGIPPTISRLAMRSGNNYPHILAKRLGAELTDLTVSGATLGNVLSEPQGYFQISRFEPQLAGLPLDVDIVTITGGGNDLGYIGGVIRDALNATLLGSLLAWLLHRPASKPLSSEGVAERFKAIIDKIRTIAPRAQIILVEYLTLFGPDIQPKDIMLDEAQISHHRNVADCLEKAYRLAAEARPGVTVISVGEMSRRHGLGSEEPWVEGMCWKGAFHPNLKGMKAVAEMIYEELRIEFPAESEPQNRSG